MNFIDWIIFAIITLGVVKGLTDGLVRQLVSLAGIIIGSWVAIHYADFTAKFLLTIYDFPIYIWKPLSFFLPFIIVIILANLLATIFQKVLSGIGLGPLNHVAGAVFGGIKFVLIISIALNLFQQLDNKNSIIKSSTKENSITFYPVLKISPAIFPYLQNYFHQEKEIEIKDKKEVVG
ncbi:MAG: CvpA family protein [Bacteroidales bacterium]|nr:CvpA family protein [Bacteroidales bacterium]